MRVVRWEPRHAEASHHLARLAREAERRAVPLLPDAEVTNPLAFAELRYGFAAMEGDELRGYCFFYGPFDHAFGSTTAKGAFSGLGMHAVAPGSEARVWLALYRAAAETLARDGVTSHALSLYAHDAASERFFFENGFGMRCADAMRRLESCAPFEDARFSELAREEIPLIRPLRRALAEHLASSPCFMRTQGFDDWLRRAEARDTRLFAARENGEIAAYFEAGAGGENEIADDERVVNLCGAYCLPAYRGKIAGELMDWLSGRLRAEGRAYLGVDYETINPAALGFWRKRFCEYTHSLVRRIDEGGAQC